MPEYALIVLWIAVLTLVLAVMAFVAVRASRLKSGDYPSMTKPGSDHDLAGRAAESLSRAIGFETVIGSEPPEWSEWVKLREYIKSRYPLLHKNLSHELVAGYSILFRWPAAEPAKAAGKSSPADGTDAGETTETSGLPILFCAHLDVVPASGEWTYPPFSGEIADGYVWGRGALDCKNILICLLEAVESLIAQGFRPKRDIYFAFGHDEETGGSDGAGSIARLFLQRGIKFAMVLDEGGALSRGIIPVGRPVAEVCAAEKGMANYRITALGTGGHSSTPPRHTALGRLSEAVARVEFRQRKARLTPVILDGLRALAPAAPYKTRMHLANLWLFKHSVLKELSKEPKPNAMIRTTVAPTMSRSGSAPNVLPDRAEAVLNARLLHGEDENALLTYLRDLTSDLGVQVEMTMGVKPSAVSDYKGESFAALSESICEVFGKGPVAPSLFAGATDARHYEPFCGSVFRFMPFILAPDDHESIHGVNERVMVDALGAAVGFYRDLIKRLA